MRRIINKKLLLVISMLAVAFAFAGCSSRVDVTFDYDPDELAQYVQTTAQNYMDIVDVDEQYNYVINEGTEAGLSEVEIDAVKAMATLEDTCGEFISFKSNYSYKESNGNVIVSVYAECTDKEAVFQATFSDNSVTYDFYRYAYLNQTDSTYTEDNVDEALASSGLYPYEMTEFTVASNQSLGDTLKNMNTTAVIGAVIAIVVILIIIIVIVALKKKPEESEAADVQESHQSNRNGTDAAPEIKGTPIPGNEDATVRYDTRNEQQVSYDDEATVHYDLASAPVITGITNTATGQSAMDDSELVAVITAAVMASEQGSPRVRVNYPSNDKLVVRPRKRNRRY